MIIILSGWFIKNTRCNLYLISLIKVGLVFFLIAGFVYIIFYHIIMICLYLFHFDLSILILFANRRNYNIIRPYVFLHNTHVFEFCQFRSYKLRPWRNTHLDKRFRDSVDVSIDMYYIKLSVFIYILVKSMEL